MWINEHFWRIFLGLMISLALSVFLLVGNVSIVRASEISLNTKVSVKLPESPSGNPGEIVTLVLELENRDNFPMTFVATCTSELQWNLLYQPNFSIEPFSRAVFPLSVQIPENVPANAETWVEITFKPEDSSAFPAIRIPIRINPLPHIDFQTDANTGKGTPGSIVQYNIMVANLGNTTERFTLRCHSENGWKTTIQPESFRLAPGETYGVLLQHHLPASPQTGSDQLTVFVHWGQNQKIIILTSVIDSPVDISTRRFNLWQGNFSLYHPDITDINGHPFSNSLSLKGPITPETIGWLYLADPFNSNRRWFFDYQTHDTSFRLGEFSIPWPGILGPAASVGNLQVTGTYNSHHYTVYSWQPSGAINARPLGAEIAVDEHSSCSFLYHNNPQLPQAVFEWDYQNNLPGELQWKHKLAYNTIQPANLGYSLALQGNITGWAWNTSFTVVENNASYLQKRNGSAVFSRPSSDTRPNSEEYQLQYEFADPISGSGYTDFWLTANYRWSTHWQMKASQKYHYPDGSSPSNNTSLFIDTNWSKDQFTHHGWLNISLDNTGSTSTDYTKLDWSTTYALDTNSSLIADSQLIHNSLAGPGTETTDSSRLGFGYKKRWEFGPEFCAMYYHLFNATYFRNLKLTLDWPIYQYHLTFTYSGFMKQDAAKVETCSIGFGQNFTWAVKKPLGTVDGFVFLDENQNGIWDTDEPKLQNLELIFDQDRTITTNSNGRLIISDLNPGEHRISLEPKFETIYQPKLSETKFYIKPYQTSPLEIPLIRLQNIAGFIYLDQNQNGKRDENETGLSDIRVILTPIGREVSYVTTDYNGTFIFYQVTPGICQITIEQSSIPDGLQLPSGFSGLLIDTTRLAEYQFSSIGLIPVTKPDQTGSSNLPSLMINMEPQVISTGHDLDITLTSTTPLQSLVLIFPNQTQVKLKTSPNQMKWTYRMNIPRSAPAGPMKITALAVDENGNHLQAEGTCLTIITL